MHGEKVGAKKRHGLTGDRNQCVICGALFISITAFDQHHTGPMHARRCLSVDEMRARGMALDARGYWHTSTDTRCTACAGQHPALVGV